MNNLYFDIETRSTLDLLETGVYPYALDTDILCLVYHYKNQYKVFIPLEHMKAKLNSKLVVSLEELQKDFEEADVLVAHNANFERIVCNHHGLTNQFKIMKWKCTAAKAAYYGLPRSLEKSSEALQIDAAKDMGGKTIMLKMCKPKKTKDGSLEWVEDEDLFIKLVKYCVTDVKVSMLLDEALPDIPKSESIIYAIDQLINDKGFPVNTKLAAKLKSWIEDEEISLLEEFCHLTDNFVTSPRQRDNALRWLHERGVKPPDLRAATVDRLLTKKLPSEVHRFLEIRKALSKSSAKKLNKFITMVMGDNHIRGTLLYHGASTARWASRGVQVQNMPRDVLSESELEYLEGCPSKEEAEFALGVSPFQLASKAIRGIIKAPEGYLLAASDYSAIESRVLAWLVDDYRILEAFRNGLDPYKINAADIFDTTYKKVTKAQRQIGKVSELALGYQGWINAFKSMAVNYDIKMVGEDDELKLVEANKLVKDVILAWRENRPLVRDIWSKLEQGAVSTIRDGQERKVGKVIFRKEKFNKHYGLTIELPSGRKLNYQRIGLAEKEHFGRKKIVITYYKPLGSSFTENKTYGGQFTENIVQAISRDLLAYSMVYGYRKYKLVPNFHVHDELANVVPKNKAKEHVARIEESMLALPPWATGLPLAVETNVTVRYGK
jgi:DNA polymerase